MNDIEILEDIISEYKATTIEWKFGNVPVHLDERDIEAIKNLIQRNKDLEQIEKEHKEENGRLRDRIKELEKENQKEFKRGFFTKVAENKANTLKIESQVIPKSLVREKMDNDIKTNEHTILGGRRNGKTLEYGIRLGRIQMCEELLEESEK